jgi:hypothetical protein
MSNVSESIIIDNSCQRRMAPAFFLLEARLAGLFKVFASSRISIHCRQKVLPPTVAKKVRVQDLANRVDGFHFTYNYSFSYRG